MTLTPLDQVLAALATLQVPRGMSVAVVLTDGTTTKIVYEGVHPVGPMLDQAREMVAAQAAAMAPKGPGN